MLPMPEQNVLTQSRKYHRNIGEGNKKKYSTESQQIKCAIIYCDPTLNYRTKWICKMQTSTQNQCKTENS